MFLKIKQLDDSNLSPSVLVILSNSQKGDLLLQVLNFYVTLIPTALIQSFSFCKLYGQQSKL